ncbi:MAG: recombination protein RecR [Simkaniaceae bacterium]|nr:recombination protein RecR [Simkaniaceae bacterium]
MSEYPAPLETLISHFQKLPGVGRKTAERFAFKILTWKSSELSLFASHLKEIQEELSHCETCGALISTVCPFCTSSFRDRSRLCVVATPKDIFSIEKTHQYQGLYHVLGALLSPIDGIFPEKLHLHKLKARLHAEPIQEVIIALDSTLEGDTTSLFLKEELKHLKLTRLAFGMPMGSSIDYVDESTLSQAFTGRQLLHE